MPVTRITSMKRPFFGSFEVSTLLRLNYEQQSTDYCFNINDVPWMTITILWLKYWQNMPFQTQVQFSSVVLASISLLACQVPGSSLEALRPTGDDISKNWNKPSKMGRVITILYTYLSITKTEEYCHQESLKYKTYPSFITRNA